MQDFKIERSIWINAPRARVWGALTQPDQLKNWWGLDWEMPPLKVGETVKLTASETGVQLAEIAVVDPLEQLTLHWQVSPNNPTTNIVSTYTLGDENGGTRLELLEAGYELLPDDIREKRFTETGAAYQHAFENLKNLLENNR